MLMKRMLLVLCLISIASLSYAGIIKGSLGSGKIRTVPLVTGDSTFLPVEVMNDNINSDFDIYIVDIDDNIVCSSTSTIRQVEKLECGLQPETDYSVLVQNFRGPSSPFRLYMGDEISVFSAVSMNGGTVDGEIAFQDLPVKVRDQIKRISSRK